MCNQFVKLKRHSIYILLATLILAGCAAQRLHNEGMSLLEEGRNEEGLAKLAAASKADPGNLSFKTTLVRNRDLIINRLLMNANNERVQEHYPAAQSAYENILRIDPDNNAARDGLAALDMDKRHIGIISEATAYYKKGDLDSARAVLKPVLIENPRNIQAILLQRQIDEQAAKILLAEPALQGKFKKPVTLQFRDANLKMVFEALSRTSGINVLLDKDVKADIKTSIFVKDVSIEDAIDLILLQSQLEKKIISDNTVFVYPNTPAKLKDYQDLKIRSFHLTNSDPKQVMNMVKTLLKTKDILVNEKTNSVVMRDTPEAIRLAEKMINDQDIADPEVMLEVEVLEVNRTRLSQIGINFPSKLSLTAKSGLTLNQLQNITAGDLVTSPALATTLNLMMQDGTTNLLASPRIRVKNREKAKIMIGDRVPVINNAVTPTAAGNPVITGNIQYMDVGMKLEVEPEIHLDSDISIKVHLDVSSIVKEIVQAASGTQAYQIGTRNASTVLRLRDGETQILAGLISDEDRKTSNKVPGLGQLPILGRLFSDDGSNTSKTEIILSITPHIVGRKTFPDAREVEYWSGTEASLRTSSLTMKSLGNGSIGFGNPAKTPDAAATINQQPPAGTASAAAATAAVEKAARDLATQPVVISWAGPNKAKVGEKISVMINTPMQLGVRSLSFQVGYDTSVLKAVDVIEGNLMKQNNAKTNLVKTINHKNGIVLVGLSGTATGESSGGGNIVTLEFEVVGASPSSNISVSRITSAATSGGSLALSAPDPHVISVTQ
jgi:general secretion pathway protein D